MLAGVSASYYTRLEQGQSRNASAQVLDAIAGALRLSVTERQHLSVLIEAAGRTRNRQARRPPVERADPALLELLQAVGEVPSVILGRRSDVLAWNPMGHSLLAGHLAADSPDLPSARPNMTEVIFLDVDTRHLYVDWTSKARAVVGNLRLVAGAHPDDPALASLIGRLIMASSEFNSMWADHTVAACAAARYELDHPLVGRLTITQQTLRSVETPEQTLVTCTAAAGSPSQEALTLLQHLIVRPGQRPAEVSAGPNRTGPDDSEHSRSDPMTGVERR